MSPYIYHKMPFIDNANDEVAATPFYSVFYCILLEKILYYNLMEMISFHQ